MIRAIVADRDYLVRRGIRAILEKTEDIQVIGETGCGYETVSLAEQLLPDVIITDLSLPGLNGIQVIRKIRKLKVMAETIILSKYSDQIFVKKALACGAKGYLLKTAEKPEILPAVRAVLRGEIFLCRPLDKLDLKSQGDCRIATDDKGFAALSLREREVLHLVAEGFNNKGIAQQLRISVKTVEKHKTNLKRKLGIYTTIGLLRVALKHHLIVIGEYGYQGFTGIR